MFFLSTQHIATALGVAAGTGLLLFLVHRWMTPAKTPLPDFKALVNIKRASHVPQQPTQTRMRIPTKDVLEKYTARYKQYYTAAIPHITDEDIAAALSAERQIHVAYLEKECAAITPLIDAVCEKMGTTRELLDADIAAAHAAGHPAWTAIYSKFTVENMTSTEQINIILREFEEHFFDKAHAELTAADEAAAAAATTPPPDDFSLDDVYTDDDTTPLTAHTPPLEQRIAEKIESNPEFLRIRFYFYNLQIAVLREKMAAIMRGERDADYMEQATEKYLKTKYARLKHAILIEYTPVGTVCMYYNSDNMSFEYYSDNATPYPILETVARRYCHLYGCRELYVIVENETVDMYAADTIAERKGRALKNKNDANARMTADRREQTPAQRAAIRSWGQSSSLKPVEPEIKQFKRRVNNFVKKAPIADFKPLQTVPAAKKCKPLTWADYASRRAPVKTIAGMEMHESIAQLPAAVSGGESSLFSGRK